MAKKRADKELYDRMRASGVRKKVARQLAELPRHVSNGRRAPKPVREAVERLQAVVEELRGHAGGGAPSTPARKPARGRRSPARSASAGRSASTRAKRSASGSARTPARRSGRGGGAPRARPKR